MKKLNKIMIVLIVISIQVLIISLTYSFFDVDFRNVEEETSVGVTSGEVAIEFDGGPNLVTNSTGQSTSAIITKEFTVTARNTMTNIDELDYSISIIINKNTFTNNAISYKLTGTGSNGTRVPDKLDRIGLKTNSGIHTIGNGSFIGEISGKTHSYVLEIYFHPNDSDIVDNMGKDFEAYVVIGEYKLLVNSPDITEGLTPIKFNGLSEVTTTTKDPDWYNYENKKWANAKTNDGSYWVWVPRYAYKISSCYHLNSTQCNSSIGKEFGNVEIYFLESLSNKTFEGNTVSLTPTYSGSSQTNIVRHPAFTFGNEEVSGFWVSKFEMSGSISNLSSKPNVSSLRNTTVGNMFSASKNIKNDSKFGFNSNDIDSHMLKNIEWGAITYLSISKYGANERVYKNNSSHILRGVQEILHLQVLKVDVQMRGILMLELKQAQLII